MKYYYVNKLYILFKLLEDYVYLFIQIIKLIYVNLV